MKIHYILAIVLIVLAAFFLSNAIAAPINKNMTNATFGIELSKSSFAANETITGVLRIPLNIALDAEDEIELRIQLPMKRVSAEKTLASALYNASFTVTQAAPTKNATNPETEKTISFSNGGEKSIAIKADPYSNFVSLDMDMEGASSNTLNNVKIDIGNDGTIDWYYLGTKISGGWATEFTKPEGIGNSGGQSLLITANTTMYCQVIDLPFAKDFQVFAWYKTLNSAGNLTASIVSLSSEEAPISIAPYSLECDLPEQTDFAWNSCTVESTDYGIHGKYAVCIYSKNGTGTDLYDIKADEGPSTTYNTCPRPLMEEESIQCNQRTERNPQIKIKQATYNKELKGDVEFTAWDYEAEAVKTAVEAITGESPEGICNDIACTIELKFIANSSGTIELSNLDFRYEKDGETPRSTNFFDLDTTESSIGKISKGGENVTLPAAATIEIPLEVFQLKAPQPVVATANSGTAEARFGTLFANATITIGAGGTSASPSSAQGMADEARTAFNSIKALAGDAQVALIILGIDKDIDAALSELANISSGASADTPAARTAIESLRESLPKEVTLGSSVKDFQLIEPNDVTEDIAPAESKESVYLAQEKAQIKASITTVSIKLFSGTTKKYALVKKEIIAKETLGKFDIYEVIDKSIADSSSDIVFETTPTSVVKEDPIVKWFVGEGLGTGAKKEQRYVIKTEFDVPIEKVKTIIVPSDAAAETPECEGENCGAEEAVCGDGTCTLILEDETICPEDCGSKTPWATIIIIIVICLALAGYLLFYRGKYSLWNLTKKKKPFSTPAELESVKTFIRASRDKQMDDSVIKTKLHEKGWKEEQIKFAFGEMEWEKKEKSVEKPSENLTPVQEYIKTALSRNMPKDKILKNLVSKGWKEEDVKKELKI